MYCSVEDIKKAIPEENILQLTDDEGTGTINEDIVQDAIDYAQQLIDGYLRGRYTTPLNPVPAFIKRIAVDMAVFYLYSRRFELDMPPSMLERRKETIRLLEQIQAGKVLIGAETPDSPGQGYYLGIKKPEDRVFSNELLNRF